MTRIVKGFIKRLMRRLWACGCRGVLLLAAGLFAVDAVIIGLSFPALGWLALAGGAYRLTRRRWHNSGSYGTARVAGRADLVRGRMLCKSGVILGRVGGMAPTIGQAVGSLLNPAVGSEQACRNVYASILGRRWSGDEFIRVNDFVHLLTVSPAGGGKSIGVLLPTLLSYAGNSVVVDPKGELFTLTSEHRRKTFGHTIVRLDPARLLDRQYGPGDCLNPLDWIDARAMDFIDRCRDLANMVILRTGLEHETHFLDSSENVLAAFTAYICATEGNPAVRNLRGVRTYLASRELYNGTLVKMQENEDFHGVLEQLGHSLTWHVDRELGSVMSTVQRQTHIFDAPLVAAATERTSFDPRQLRAGKMTVYLTIPAEYLSVWAALQRMWLGTLLRLATRGVPTENNALLFLVDEAAHIGQMRALEDAVTLLRGAGIRIWLFLQSLEQLKKCFGDNAATVLDNMSTQQYFGIRSYETADILSKRMGKSTLVIRTDSGNEGTSTPVGGDGKSGGSRSSGSSYNISEIARDLLSPDEILVLPPTTALVFHKNSYVVFCDRITYYADRAFRRRKSGYGTGRTPGLGFGGMVPAVLALAMSALVTAFVAGMPNLLQQQTGPRPESAWEAFGGVPMQPVAPAPYGPGTPPYGDPPLPYYPYPGFGRRVPGGGFIDRRIHPANPFVGRPGSFGRSYR